jgi:hypothetical protein
LVSSGLRLRQRDRGGFCMSAHARPRGEESSRCFLELHGDVHQADLLSSTFTQSRKVLGDQLHHIQPSAFAPWSKCLHDQHSSNLTVVDSLL